MIVIDFAKQSDASFLKENSILSRSELSYKIDNQEILIAKNEKILIGFLIFDYLWSHTPFLVFIKVLDKYQGNGTGRELLKFLENHLRANGQSILFSSSMENATAAQGWHRKMGFRDAGIIHDINENNVGELFFRKELN